MRSPELHKRKVLHRDIKPSNVIVTRAGLPTLLDFGAAREFINDPDVSHTLVGTMGYAAPEQFYSRQAQGPFTDVYGLAATLYFLLTGTSPRLLPITTMMFYLSPRVAKGP
jgi:serine/threonine protein kinase